MEPFRFDFETDQQYQERIQSLSNTNRASTNLNTNQSTNTNTAVNTNTGYVITTGSPNPALGQGGFLVFPWWVLLVIFLLLLLGFYESYRRKMTRAYHRLHQRLQQHQAQQSSLAMPETKKTVAVRESTSAVRDPIVLPTTKAAPSPLNLRATKEAKPKRRAAASRRKPEVATENPTSKTEASAQRKKKLKT